MDQTSLPRTYLLTERIPADCRLSAADVAFLSRRHRAHIRLSPSNKRGHLRLTPTGHVGTIVAPRCRLVIRPKIPLANLFHLLDPESSVLTAADRSTPSAADEILDFLASRLARLLAERSAAGLHRAYTERAETGPFLHGRLDVPAQANDIAGRKDRLHSRYEDFTADLPCNQVPRATAEMMLRSLMLRETTRARLRQSLTGFSDVQSVPLDCDTFRAPGIDAGGEAYRPLRALCRLLVDSLAPGETAGPVPGPAFLLEMERVFERYVTAGVVGAFEGQTKSTVAEQPFLLAADSIPRQPDFHVRPDILIHHEGRPVLLLDMKWKKGPRPALVTPDIYQVLAYCTALGVNRAVLVYPGHCDRCWTYPLTGSAVVVEVRTLRVIGSTQDCAESLSCLVSAVRNQWESL